LRKLWANREEFHESWKGRIEKMSRYLRPPSTVADFGCGMMWLEEFLPRECTYLPIDYIQRDARTLLVDLNEQPLPRIAADTAFFSGVLEYIVDLQHLATQLAAGSFRRVIVSYCTLDKYPDMASRRQLNWVSHKSTLDLLALFVPRFAMTAIDDFNNNSIFVFDRAVP
jgi:hypothetical protein